MPKLGLSMIVKDAEVTLARCLESTRGIVDEIVIGDTGCSDASMEVARHHGATVVRVPWENDFAKARNRVLEENRADWVLFLDADEMLDPGAQREIPPLLESEEVSGYKVWIWNYVVKLTARLWDKPAKSNPGRLEASLCYPGYIAHDNVRLFRRAPDVYFEGRVHETPGRRILVLGRKLAEAPFVIHHFGVVALDAEARARKNEFYRELGRAKARESPNDGMAQFEVGIEELDNFHDPAAALPYFQRVVEIAPRAARGWTFLGVCLVRLGKYREGLKKLLRAEKLGGHTWLLCEAEGDAYYHLGDFRTARRCYERAQQHGGTAAIIESKLGVCEVRLGRAESGIRHLENGISREPHFAELYDLMVIAAVFLGRPRLAAETAARSLGAVQPTPERFLKAATLYAQLGQWQPVGEILRVGQELFPDNAKLQLAWKELQERKAHLSEVVAHPSPVPGPSPETGPIAPR